MIRPLIVTIVALLPAMTGAQADQNRSTAQLDMEIGVWAARTERDPDDYISPTRLGYARLRKARIAGDFREYAAAEAALTEALKRQPDHYTALLGLGTARSARHRFADAIVLGMKAAVIQPDDPDAYALIGDANLGLGDLDRAQAAYAELEKRAPGFDADTRRANLLQARGKSREAIALLRAALSDATPKGLPAESRSWCQVMIGATLFDLGDWDAAEPEYQAALKLTRDNYVAIEHLAELRSYQRRDKEALALYERAIALAPHPDFFEAVARTHEWAGRSEEAKRWHVRARDGYLDAVKASDPGYYRNLAMYFTDVEPKPDEAVAWARKDLELRQDHAAWSALAWALLGKGDIAGARDASAKATASDAEDAGMWFRAGMIEKAAGNTAGARAALQRALAINSKFDRAAEARKLLEILNRK